jgi:hypothetical protein
MLVLLVFTAFAVAIVGHAFAAWRHMRVVLTIAGLGALAVALALALGAPSLLPLLEVWWAGRLYKDTSMYAVSALQFLQQSWHTLPLALFAPATLAAVRDALPSAFPYALAPALGVAGLTLAVIGLLRRGLDAALVAVALLGVGMALAPFGLGWMRRLPLLQYVYPMYCWPLVALPLAQAAGHGVAAVAVGRERRIVVAALAIIFVGALSLFLVEDYRAPYPFGLMVQRVFLHALATRTGWVRLALPFFLTLGLLLVVASLRRRQRWSAAVAALAVVELGASISPAAWFRDSQVLTAAPSAAVRFLQERLGVAERMLGVPLEVGYPNTPSLFGLADMRGMVALPAERFVRYLNLISRAETWRIWQHTAGVTMHPLLDLAAVRYVVLRRVDPPSALASDAAARLVYQDPYVTIYENAAALPRARIVHTAFAVSDADEAATQLAAAVNQTGHAAAIGLADKVFVEPSADGIHPPAASGAAGTADEHVTIVPDDDPDRVTVHASLATSGYLVLADTFYPGWTASIGGAPTPIHPANLLFRGVFVPAGEHTVVFRYAPNGFTAGLVLFGIGVAVSAAILAHAAVRIRSRAAEECAPAIELG